MRVIEWVTSVLIFFIIPI